MSRRSGKRRWTQWSEADARAALAEWQESGAGALAFARSKGVSAQRLYYWQKRIAQTDEITFVPVVMPARTEARIEARIEIECAGLVVRVREDLDDQHLSRIVATLAKVVASC